MQVDVEATVESLVALDVATVAHGAVAQLRAARTEEDAVYLMREWNHALGSNWQGVAKRSREIAGRPGYRNAARQLSQSCAGRKQELATLAAFLDARSRRDIDRRRWSAVAYRNQVERFIEDFELGLRWREAKEGFHARGYPYNVAAASVLAAVAASYERAIAEAKVGTAYRGAHAVARLGDLCTAVDLRERERNQSLSERNDARERAEAVGDPVVSTIRAIPSLKAQTQAYASFLRGVQVAHRTAEVSGACDAVAASLSALETLTQSLARSAPPTSANPPAENQPLPTVQKPSVPEEDPAGGKIATPTPPIARAKRIKVDTAKKAKSDDATSPAFSAAEGQILDRAAKLLEAGLPEAALAEVEILTHVARFSPLSLITRGLLHDRLGDKEAGLADCRRAARSDDGPLYKIAVAAGLCIACLPDQLERAGAAITFAKKSGSLHRLTLELLLSRYRRCRRSQR